MREGQQVRAYVFLVAVALLTSVGDAIGGAESHEVPRLWVTLCDSTGFQPNTLEKVREEVSRIFSSSGTEMSWQGCGQLSGKGEARDSEAWVFILADLPRWLANDEPGAPRALAHVITKPGATPGPVIYVSRIAVAAIIVPAPPHLASPSLLSRALGRVLAHELAHRFLRQADHAPEGILRTKFEGRELLNESLEPFSLTKEQCESLQNLTQESASPIPANP